jgi:hypothetical protein
VAGVDVEFYATAGPLTTLTPAEAEMVGSLELDPQGLCRLAQGLLISPSDAARAGLAQQRMSEINIRPASALLQRVLELDDTTLLSERRQGGRRVVGTCRHYAVLATAFLRSMGVPARGRCGFATYFVPPKKVDHWIVEYWSGDDRRWVRIDAEYSGRATLAASRPDDLRPGEFLSSGEAWQLIRSGEQDPAEFGVFGTENWGPGEVRGNAMRDLASLVDKVEMLPWDEWGPMKDSYDGKTGDDFDRLIDAYAMAAATDDSPTLRHLYEQLTVPASMIC